MVLDSGEVSVVTDLENTEISPLFAVYVGGQSTLIAGKGRVLLFYIMD